jgi:hypothetical protein
VLPYSQFIAFKNESPIIKHIYIYIYIARSCTPKAQSIRCKQMLIRALTLIMHTHTQRYLIWPSSLYWILHAIFYSLFSSWEQKLWLAFRGARQEDQKVVRKRRVFSPSQGTAHATLSCMLPSFSRSAPSIFHHQPSTLFLAFPFSGGGWQWRWMPTAGTERAGIPL